MSRGPMPEVAKPRTSDGPRKKWSTMRRSPSTVSIEPDDVAALEAGDADDVLEQLVIVARIAGRAEVMGIAAEAGEVRLDLGIDAGARVLDVVERVVAEGQAGERGQRLALRFLDRERGFAVAFAEGPVGQAVELRVSPSGRIQQRVARDRHRAVVEGLLEVVRDAEVLLVERVAQA